MPIKDVLALSAIGVISTCSFQSVSFLLPHGNFIVIHWWPYPGQTALTFLRSRGVRIKYKVRI